MGGDKYHPAIQRLSVVFAKPQDKYVVGAVSGGVDSSVAAVRSTQSPESPVFDGSRGFYSSCKIDGVDSCEWNMFPKIQWLV